METGIRWGKEVGVQNRKVLAESVGRPGPSRMCPASCRALHDARGPRLETWGILGKADGLRRSPAPQLGLFQP